MKRGEKDYFGFFFFEDIDFEGLLDQEKSRLVFLDVDSYYSKEE